MSDFLKEELSGLPPTLIKSILAELESIVRTARFAVMSDAVGYNEQCVRITSRLAACLQLTSRLREELSRLPKDNA